MKRDLYREAMAADAAFSEALARAYGSEACNARYRFGAHADAEVQAALVRKLNADATWIASLKAVQS